MKHFAMILLTVIAAVVPVEAQDLIVPKHGDPITAYNLDAGSKFYFYTMTPAEDGETLRIAKDSVLMIRRADGSVLAPSPELSAAAPAKTDIPVQNNFPEIKEEDIHGSLIAKGNCVYIPTDGQSESERVGQTQLKKRIQEWNYWNVVDRLEQAHFVLQYVIQSEGKDYCQVLIRPRKYYLARPFFFDEVVRGENVGILVGSCRIDDSNPKQNEYCANKIFTHLKEMLTNPNYKSSTTRNNRNACDFFEKMQQKKYMDADNKTNNVWDKYVSLYLIID